MANGLARGFDSKIAELRYHLCSVAMSLAANARSRQASVKDVDCGRFAAVCAIGTLGSTVGRRDSCRASAR